MLTLAGAVLQFSRLERVEVGGTKGISAAIKAVHADFMAAYERFQQVGIRKSLPQVVCMRIVPVLTFSTSRALVRSFTTCIFCL
jgi:hypothetical protein